MIPLFENIEVYLFAGIFGYMWVNHLTMPGEVAGSFPAFVNWMLGIKEQHDYKGWRYAITKITYDCDKCVAGFWTMVVLASLGDLEAAAVGGVASAFVAVVLSNKI
jgi:hypothetical protein